MEHKRVIHREGPALIDILLGADPKRKMMKDHPMADHKMMKKTKRAAGGPVPPAAGFRKGGRACREEGGEA